MSFATPSAEARDHHRDRDRHDHWDRHHHSRVIVVPSYGYGYYPRSYYYGPRPYYYSGYYPRPYYYRPGWSLNLRF